MSQAITALLLFQVPCDNIWFYFIIYLFITCTCDYLFKKVKITSILTKKKTTIAFGEQCNNYWVWFVWGGGEREGIAYYRETRYLQSVIHEFVSSQITHEARNKMFSTATYWRKYVTYALLVYYCTIINRKKWRTDEDIDIFKKKKKKS